ncbi:MAG: TIGR04282 family arsenosugar biosynthesis glycosyltransferase [Pseudomonadota bacterium]|nr:TIGR04282 family arsenosugar biosynthesis glycosyltransferase [Pseudomonadota bacterium]
MPKTDSHLQNTLQPTLKPTLQRTPLVMQFSKWPEAGRVKTRLIPALGVAGALDAHVTLSLEVLDNLCATGFDVEFWWDRPLETPPEDAAPVLKELEGAGIPQCFQEGENLGARMAAALAGALQEREAAIIVGSDCPSVDPGYVRKAAAALSAFDVVLGPSNDGGYVLIGARRMEAAALANVAWGTPAVLEQTLARMASAGLTVTTLEPRWDVDEPDDWARYQKLAGTGAC